ncbi:MAG: pilus (MSHA type) biogenesis protein MshL [Desulfuromonadales bacterium]|nr:pilus (MSHA type) biogenesis protein MshL [Desulfuromonadales bacterium]MDW7758741.1 pilus (MSHA type) biogenesis protein MshL [Desulfuromonadales bacterium]
MMRRSACFISRILLLTALLGLSACLPARGPAVEEGIADALSQPVSNAPRPAAPEIPPAVASALLSPLDAGLGRPELDVEPRFDIVAEQTPARQFFTGLVAGTATNMVVHPEVTGDISLTMKNASIPEVLEVVRSVFGYEYRLHGNTYQILPAGLQSRIFPVNYLNLSRKGLSQTRVSSGQVSEAESGDDEENDSSSDRRSKAVSGSRIDTESMADFWKELEYALRTLIGAEDGRRVVVQPQASVVIVRAMPEELREVESYLTAMQGNLQRQVILEAKILEVELNDGFQSGINWAALGRPSDGKSLVIGQTGGGSFFNSGASEIVGNTGILNPNALTMVEGTATSAFGGVFSAALDFKDFTAFIELLESQGEVQVLSSPRISTVNNQKAVIKVGTDEFFVTDISSTTVTGTTTTTTPDITLTPFFSGIALDVTPQIDHNGQVTLHIHPTVSEVQDQQKTITVANQEQQLPLAFSSVRESDSIVSATSGQVVVIGGLMKNQKSRQKASVPLLGRIPLLGHLFSHNQMVSRKSELVILLRPQVVDNGRVWERELENTRNRVQSLGGAMGRTW